MLGWTGVHTKEKTVGHVSDEVGFAPFNVTRPWSFA